jgi:hypothetical protein
MAGVPVGFGDGAGCLRPACAGQGGIQLHGHLLRGGLGVSAPLVSFGGELPGGGLAGFGGGPLLGSRADGFHLGFGLGRVGHRLDRLPQPAGDTGDPISLGTQRTQQFRARHLGHLYRMRRIVDHRPR